MPALRAQPEPGRARLWRGDSTASPYLDRSPGHGGRQADASFLFRCVRQGDGIRQLDERGIEKRGLFGQLMAFLRISLPATTKSVTGVLAWGRGTGRSYSKSTGNCKMRTFR